MLTQEQIDGILRGEIIPPNGQHWYTYLQKELLGDRPFSKPSKPETLGESPEEVDALLEIYAGAIVLLSASAGVLIAIVSIAQLFS